MYYDEELHLLNRQDVIDDAVVACADKVITGFKLDRWNEFAISLEGERTIKLKDHGQSCCESRYITCDDDLDSFVGAKFTNVLVKPACDLPGSDEHEAVFVEVHTTKGSFTLCTHNEHNGFYGGFDLKISTEGV